ncbi:N-acetylmuramoyl-L-alanine amidase family protein [Anaerovorax sp. IOR16]|uniref:N-acetylmuramoyl-L-alanine amidase family protein n=1 Tax=Anaerovorax sp. IOR16 TaxID=2773458 RepID=UPI0019D22FF8|nr:N-acetylmuramoyl-L-alanine amidase [Anaerovorax sp. IOR16]
MPSLYLSPSVQEDNNYINGGTEEYYMNLIVDAMVPYLRASGIEFDRNNPNDSLSQVIALSNSKYRDLHLALHSNSSPENLSGMLQGPDVYHYAYSPSAQRASDIIAENLESIYPLPNLITVIPTTTLDELRRTKAPAVLVELAYHDNFDDAQWIKDNINSIARNLSLSLAEYFGAPFRESFQ